MVQYGTQLYIMVHNSAFPDPGPPTPDPGPRTRTPTCRSRCPGATPPPPPPARPSGCGCSAAARRPGLWAGPTAGAGTAHPGAGGGESRPTRGVGGQQAPHMQHSQLQGLPLRPPNQPSPYMCSIPPAPTPTPTICKNPSPSCAASPLRPPTPPHHL